MRNSQYQDSTHTVVVAGRKGHPLDPVAWWCLYVALVPAPQEAAAFGYTSEGVCMPLVHTEFVTWVKRLLSRAGFDSSKYAGHSFRRGAATFSFLVGLPDLLVKEMGAASLSHVQRSLLRRDVVVDRAQYCLFVTLQFMRNSQYQDSTHTVVVAGRKGHPLDPVAWWCLYVALVPAPQEAAAFGYTSEGVYVPLVHTEFITWVKRLLSRASFDSSKYAGHSFRRGAATFSFLVGLPDLLVKEMGAWRSQVYQVYMDLSLSQKLSVHSTWFDAMAAGQLGGVRVAVQVVYCSALPGCAVS
uniref:Tyr recombinase domain-containing protein n=1 Tax=Tetradesmus obliquus TaxID=3088 RepID=A0A383WC58_TETOB|eukprot:jgi/Sobl393_1/1380/SZX75021.1